jgi:DNA topoisomerase IA
VAQGAARPVRRPRAVAGAAHDRGARGRDRSLHRARVLVDRSRTRASLAAFTAKLVKLDGKKFEQFTVTDGDTAEAARERIVKAAGGALHVTDVASKERKRRPSPPFTTSTLQQEAARKLGFTTKRTMQVAQKLYEGVAIGDEGTVGLISYMRTDSVHLSAKR